MKVSLTIRSSSFRASRSTGRGKAAPLSLNVRPMNASTYRREMLIAFSFPVGLFLAFPLVVAFSINGLEILLNGLLVLVKMLVPIIVVVYLLAPWAGRNVPSTWAPAFLVGALAAISPVATFFATALVSGSLSLLPGLAAFWLFLALPGSILGSLLFIGSCQRMQEPQVG